MEFHSLGTSGLLASEIGLGCNSIGSMIEGVDPDRSRKVTDVAIDSAITFFDTVGSHGAAGGSGQVRAKAATPAWKLTP